MNRAGYSGLVGASTIPPITWLWQRWLDLPGRSKPSRIPHRSGRKPRVLQNVGAGRYGLVGAVAGGWVTSWRGSAAKQDQD
jgi:hypothetical protein